ncbi:hypothetical protein BKA70DRAFT_1315001 [Coprinopsis sp. MPI-PUGE-AT-0042]|nr:hypothetical protein BKA70DRAFT_1315001 [Coprinopsis sp. MPI-PUGE-AT-0042]
MSEVFDTEIDLLCRRLGTTAISHPAESPTLPPELLAQIFIQCIEDSENLISNGIPYPKLSPKSPLLAITHTSSYWRATAIALPELWNRVGLLHAPSQKEDNLIKSPLLHIWLERSYPLAIHLYFPWNPFDPSVLDAIASHSSRIESLSLEARVGSTSVARLLYPEEGAAIGFPALKRLSLSVAFRYPPTPITIFKDCQSLTKLSLDINTSTPSLLDINWEQLTELDMVEGQALQRARWMRLIRLCKNLRKGTFRLCSRVDLVANGVDNAMENSPFSLITLEGPCHLNYLEELTIDYRDADTLTSLLHNLHFKRLHTFIIWADSRSGFTSQRMNLGTWTKLHQLSCLVSFTICQVNMVIDDFISLLGTLQLLQELRVDLEALPIAKALRIDDGMSAQDGIILLPKLSKLELWVRGYDHNDCAIYLSMLKSRVDWTTRDGYEGDSRQPAFSVHLFVDYMKRYALLDSLDPRHPFGLDDEDHLLSQIKISHVSAHHRL